MNEGNPDFYGYPEDHEPNCIIRLKGGSGKNCNCGYLHSTVIVHKDYTSMARGNNYPFDDQIDYDPRVDNVDDEWEED